MRDIFTEMELRLIQKAFSFRNQNMVLGLASRLDFMDRSGFFEDSRAHFASSFGRELPERKLAKDYLTQELAGKRVIELGPGWVGNKLNNARFFAVLEASGYVGVEPLLIKEKSIEPRITFLPTYARNEVTLNISYTLTARDGLSYLLTQPDDSAVIFSSCVFRHDTLTDIGLPSDLGRKYVDELIKQMYRVTQSGAINIHADNIFDSQRFEEAGFSIELHGRDGTPEWHNVESTEQTELQYLVGTGGVILRK